MVATALGDPYPERSRRVAHVVMTISVVGMGAGMNPRSLLAWALTGWDTAVRIGTALTTGTLVGRWLGVHRDTSLPIAVGTAICCGSAIAAGHERMDQLSIERPAR